MADDLRTTLAGMLSARGDGNASAQLRSALMARLGQRPAGDPVQAALTRLLNPAPAEARPPVDEPARQTRQLLRAARDELNRLQVRSAALAAALGACAECWGEDAACAGCAGRGRPGWARPDAAAFAAWVDPALRALAGTLPEPPAGGSTDTVLPFARRLDDPETGRP